MYYVALAGLELAIASCPSFLDMWVGALSHHSWLRFFGSSVLMSEVRQAGPLHVLGTWEK